MYRRLHQMKQHSPLLPLVTLALLLCSVVLVAGIFQSLSHERWPKTTAKAVAMTVVPSEAHGAAQAHEGVVLYSPRLRLRYEIAGREYFTEFVIINFQSSIPGVVHARFDKYFPEMTVRYDPKHPERAEVVPQ